MITITNPAELLAMRDADGVIRHAGDLRIECDIPWGTGKDIAGLYVGGNLDVDGNLYVRGERCIILGDLYWGQAHKPKMPEQTYIKRVLPPEHQRGHWQERLGLDLSEGCYAELCLTVLKHIIRLLNDEKWSSTERWMLETLWDSEGPTPDWVKAEIEKNNMEGK